MTVQDAIQLVLQRRVRDGARTTGRTPVMKYLYFLQAQGQISLGLNYELYLWGPFAQEVLTKLDEMSSHGILQQKPLGVEKGYDIKLINPVDSALSHEFDAVVNDIFNNLSSKSPKELEGLSTLHMVRRMLPDARREEILSAVKNLKPHLKLSDLEHHMRTLEEWGWVKNPS